MQYCLVVCLSFNHLRLQVLLEIVDLPSHMTLIIIIFNKTHVLWMVSFRYWVASRLSLCLWNNSYTLNRQKKLQYLNLCTKKISRDKIPVQYFYHKHMDGKILKLLLTWTWAFTLQLFTQLGLHANLLYVHRCKYCDDDSINMYIHVVCTIMYMYLDCFSFFSVIFHWYERDSGFH